MAVLSDAGKGQYYAYGQWSNVGTIVRASFPVQPGDQPLVIHLAQALEPLTAIPARFGSSSMPRACSRGTDK